MRRSLVLCAVVAAGCGGHSPSGGKAASTAPLVPWADPPVSELRGPGEPAAQPCRASQLEPAKGGLTFEAAVEGAVGSVVLRNAGNAPCRLEGRPDVRFVGAPKQPPQRQEPLPAHDPSFPRLSRPDSTLRALAPGDVATLTVEWRNWCVPGARNATEPLTPPRAARITLPGGHGSLDVDYNAVTTCEDPARPSTLRVRPFQPPLLPMGRPWTSAVFEAKALALDGRATTLHGRRGELVGYSIALRNRGRETVRFDPCPLTVELLAPAGRAEAHRLNCAGAKPLAPGRTERFEMRIRVPGNAPLGPNGLFWELDPLGAQAPEVVSRLVVDR